MKKSRKLAWVVLGVVVVGSVVLLVQLSSLYSPWHPLIIVDLDAPGYTACSKKRYQHYPWLPGADEVSVRIEAEEYWMLVERAKQ